MQWKRASSQDEAGTSGFLYCSDVGLGCVCSFKQGVRSRLVLRHGSLLSSRVVKRFSGLQAT